MTNNKGNIVIFHEGHKYLKSGESKSSIQFRCFQYFKRCKSRIILNRDTQAISKNEVQHNHDVDKHVYASFVKSSYEPVKRSKQNKTK